MNTAFTALAFAGALLPALALAQASVGDSIACRQRTNAATGARDIVCENAKATAFVVDVARSDRSRRVRVDEVVTAPPIGPMSVTDLMTTRAAAAASRLRRGPAH